MTKYLYKSIISLVLVVFTSICIGQTVIKSNIKDIETVLNSRLGSGVYIGVSDPGMEEGKALALAYERAKLLYAVTNFGKVDHEKVRYVEEIEAGGTYAFNQTWRNKTIISGEANFSYGFKINSIVKLNTGEYIALVAIDSNVNNYSLFNYSLSYIENSLSIDDKYSDVFCILTYSYDSDDFIEEYKEDSIHNRIISKYLIFLPHKISGIFSKVSSENIIKNQDTWDKILSNKLYVTSLKCGLWNALLKCYLNQLSLPEYLNSITERYVNELDASSATEFSQSFENTTNSGKKSQMLKTDIRKLLFSEFGLSIDMRTIELISK